MPLANIEKNFVASLLQPQMNDVSFLSELLPLDSISKEMQISIYWSNVNGAHQKVLSQIYPACFNVLGEGYFNQICRAYRFKYPSVDADLNRYGEYFSVFMQEQIDDSQELQNFEYLAELASLEWHWHESYFADNDEEFSFKELDLIGSELQDRIFFRMSNAFYLHSTTYPLLDIWHANKNIPDDMQEFHMPDSEKYFCITRNGFASTVNLLDYESYILLKSILDEMSLVKLTSLDGTAAGDFKNKLMSFIQQGWITGFFLQC